MERQTEIFENKSSGSTTKSTMKSPEQTQPSKQIHTQSQQEKQ